MEFALAACVKGTLVKTAGSNCDICGLKHPKMLHIHQKRKETDKNQAERKEMDKVSASVQTSGLTGAGHDNSKLSIVPGREMQ